MGTATRTWSTTPTTGWYALWDPAAADWMLRVLPGELLTCAGWPHLGQTVLTSPSVVASPTDGSPQEDLPVRFRLQVLRSAVNDFNTLLNLTLGGGGGGCLLADPRAVSITRLLLGDQLIDSMATANERAVPPQICSARRIWPWK